MRYSCKNEKWNSGQVLVVAALVVALVICSTTAYVYELTRPTNVTHPSFLNEFVLAIKHGTKNVLVSSLANFSISNQSNILTTNLEEWRTIIERQYIFGKCLLSFSPSDASPYVNGFWRNWTTDGYGVSSASANFSLNIQGGKLNATFAYESVVTLTLAVNGTSQSLRGQTQVNVTLVLQNEESYTLARNITLYYWNGGVWTLVDDSNNLTVTDYGNGTYRLTFTTMPPLGNVEVSARVFDEREILVVANVTCSSI